MAKGVKPKDPKNDSDVDPLVHLPMLQAIFREDKKIQSDATIMQLTAISFARIAEVAVEYHAKSLRHGTVSEMRERARKLIESSLAEACYGSGRRDELHRLVAERVVSPEKFYELLQEITRRDKEIWREAAGFAVGILRDIQARLDRSGKRGRPSGRSSADGLLALVDAAILRWASAKASIETLRRPPAEFSQTTALTNVTKDEIIARIPDAVREAIRLGQLRDWGETRQESIDRHSKRIRAQFDRMVAANSGRGSSIIRKS